MRYTFPFGQPITPVRQVDNGHPKKMFILGVYASAVHVKWYGADGKLRIRAMAVASGPEIFWRGNNEYVKDVIRRINLNPKYGHLEPADTAFNGPSGICLDENYLRPLGVTRDDVWLCDLLPESRKNKSQEKALFKTYDKEVDISYNFPPVPKCIADEHRIKEIISELENKRIINESKLTETFVTDVESVCFCVKFQLRHFFTPPGNISFISISFRFCQRGTLHDEVFSE